MHAPAARYLCLCHTRRIQAPRLHDLFRRHLCCWPVMVRALPVTLAPLSATVLQIIRLCGSEEVRGVAADGVVASMANDMPGLDSAVLVQVSRPARVRPAARINAIPVTPNIGGTEPRPTLILAANINPAPAKCRGL